MLCIVGFSSVNKQNELLNLDNVKVKAWRQLFKENVGSFMPC